LTVDISNMTPEELEAHVERELELRGEIEALLKRLAEQDYRTKTEKLYINGEYQAKQRELAIHLGYETADE
jgi:hypothetical protein